VIGGKEHMFLGLFKTKTRKPVRERLAVGTLGPYDRQKIKEEWGRVAQLVQVGKPSAMKEAVVMADKMLDYALTQISSGEAMGERLKNARKAFPAAVYQGLWEAHKARNALVHDADYDLTQLVAQDSLGKFKAGFEALGIEL
jgi:hypothetical protein